MTTGSSNVQILLPPVGSSEVPAYDRGWQTGGAEPAPFISYVEQDPSVNWSDELEELHEESSRTHFLDRWTRQAILSGVGLLPARPTIADVGCSTGFLLDDLHRAQPEATLLGVDLVASGLVKAHRLVPTAHLLHANACQLPIDDASVDAVVSANLLEHVPDDQGALREFARILRPGGACALIVPAGPSTYDYYDRFLGHERRYARHELADKCRAAGLELVRDEYIASMLYVPFWLVKQRNRRVHAELHGDALAAKVTQDMQQTRDSRLGEMTWHAERWLGNAGIHLPFGIRAFVVARRPAA